MIEGVIVTQLRRVAHPKGDIMHALKRSSPGFVGFGEAYFSTVNPGAVKGWKRHRRMTLNLVVPLGRVRFVVYDDRPSSRSAGRFQVTTVGDDNYVRLTVTPGLWVAFEGVGQGTNLLLNLADEEHDADEADNADLSVFPFPDRTT